MGTTTSGIKENLVTYREVLQINHADAGTLAHQNTLWSQLGISPYNTLCIKRNHILFPGDKNESK